MTVFTRSLAMALLLAGVVACAGAPSTQSTSAAPGVRTPEPTENLGHEQVDAAAAKVCTVTEPSWVKPPEDSAVQGSPELGHYYVNEDRSIWASAWWTGREEEYLRVSEDGIKMGWFRPAGSELTITGRRIDAEAPPLEAHAPCCYPTRFQATGLSFPAEGCWEVTARAAASELSFVVWVAP